MSIIKSRSIIRYMEYAIRLKLGQKIKELRKKYSYTQEELSEAANIDYKYIQRIEGKKPPAVRIDTIEKLAKALKVKPCDLLKF
ncbi:MAG: transcriptional regulator [Candidatus Omnitrophica bacterium CG22_combo_CG10-13_8_21_14_all_43_16]|nr:MAG: transcriptional regulator [Candidatus Omnitrophica bacterium CG22_combo_CG10-13_8_21_14_all_43_16]